jgi:hypothetical protein
MKRRKVRAMLTFYKCKLMYKVCVFTMHRREFVWAGLSYLWSVRELSMFCIILAWAALNLS